MLEKTKLKLLKAMHGTLHCQMINYMQGETEQKCFSYQYNYRLGKTTFNEWHKGFVYYKENSQEAFIDLLEKQEHIRLARRKNMNNHEEMHACDARDLPVDCSAAYLSAVYYEETIKDKTPDLEQAISNIKEVTKLLQPDYVAIYDNAMKELFGKSAESPAVTDKYVPAA